jgi:hypothetical protein
MAEKSGFFDAHFVNGEYDRIYLAEHFARYFASFIGNGIFGGKSNELMVREKEPNSMSVRVLSGQAWIDGYWYENDGEHSLTIDVADGVLHRIDSIVVRWIHAERTIRLAVRKGTAATNPIAPSVQRNDDFYELKLADISIRAGATKITQANITDKRYNTDVCGLVVGVVQQLDPDEFGIQLDTYIQEFMNEHNVWKNATQSDIEQWVTNFKTQCTNWYNQFASDSAATFNSFMTNSQQRVDKLVSDGQTNINNVASTGEAKLNKTASDGQTAIDNVVNTGTANINKLISDKTAEIDKEIEDFNKFTQGSEYAALVGNVSKLMANAVESTQYPGCFYRIVNGNTEWINPPSLPGFEYMTTERWNGNPVYQTMIYAAALPNKTVMSVHVNSYFDEIISITGFAIDSDNNMHYQFPIILNGLTPVAVISFAEGDGGSGSDITINTNDDLSSFKAYVTVKYTKRVRG